MAPIINPVFVVILLSIFGFFVNALALNEFAARQECDSQVVAQDAQELNNEFIKLPFNAPCSNPDPDCPATKACVQGYLSDCISGQFSNYTTCNKDQLCLAYPGGNNATTIGCLEKTLIDWYFETWGYASGPVGLGPGNYGSLIKNSFLLGSTSTNEKRLDDSDGKTRG